jgi:hypothetical protein
MLLALHQNCLINGCRFPNLLWLVLGITLAPCSDLSEQAGLMISGEGFK